MLGRLSDHRLGCNIVTGASWTTLVRGSRQSSLRAPISYIGICEEHGETIIMGDNSRMPGIPDETLQEVGPAGAPGEEEEVMIVGGQTYSVTEEARQGAVIRLLADPAADPRTTFDFCWSPILPPPKTRFWGGLIQPKR